MIPNFSYFLVTHQNKVIFLISREFSLLFNKSFFGYIRIEGFAAIKRPYIIHSNLNKTGEKNVQTVNSFFLKNIFGDEKLRNKFH